MKKVYIVQVQGWGDNEEDFVNIAAFSTLALAEAHVVELEKQAEADDMGPIVTDVEVLTIDA